MSEVVQGEAIADPIVEAPSTETQAVTHEDGSLPSGRELYKLIVDGQEEEVDIDELKKRASHSSGAAKRMQEATKAKEDATRLLGLLKQDPFAVLKELDESFDPKDFLSTRLAKLMEEELLTPEEKQQRADAEELRALREERKRAQEEREAKDLEMMAAKEREKLDVEFAQALKEAGVPSTKSAKARLAQAMLVDLENGTNTPIGTIALAVKAEMQQELMDLLSTADEDTFEQIMGSDLLTKAQKVAIRKHKSPGNKQPVRQTPMEKKEDKEERPMTPDEFRASLGLF